MQLIDKVAVITGAGSGTGRASSLLFAREGARLVCVDVDDVMGEETCRQVRAAGGEATFVHADLGVADEVAAMAQRCIELHPRIHVLFNNAALLFRDTVENIRMEDWARTLAVNLTGPYLCSRHLLPALQQAGGASIIHHGSIDGALGNPASASYSVSKGGLVPLTHVMAHTLARYGIRVNCIHSGAIFESSQGIPVRITPELRDGSYVRDNARVQQTPLKRAGLVEECAAAALFLASDASSYVTGAIITVDGGRTAITPGTGG